MNHTKICLLGGDTRQTSLANYLAEEGYETAVWALPTPENSSCPPGMSRECSFVKCADAASAVLGSRAVILPLPASLDGVRLNCPVFEKESPTMRRELRLTSLISMLPPGTLLFAGMPGEVLRTMARDANIRLIDYYDSEAVQIKNAVPTAEGALSLAMSKMPITLHGSSAAVLGFGRIGRCLSSLLRAMGAHVCVAARSEKDLSWASVSGCRTVSFADFLENPGIPDVLFNTVPAPLIDTETFLKLPQHTLLIELASRPGGFTDECLKTAAQRILQAPSLPGKYAPYTAGRILYETVSGMLRREGITV